MQGPADPERITIHLFVMLFDSQRVLADKISREFMKVLLNRLAAPLQHGLAESDNSLVGMQFNENAVAEAKTDQPRFKFGDAHAS